MTTTAEKLQHLFQDYGEGLAARRNRPEDYLPQVIDHLRAIRDGRLDNVPAPLCVQLQVTSRCGTVCKMCQHWNEQRPELSAESWTAILTDLVTCGVQLARKRRQERLILG